MVQPMVDEEKVGETEQNILNVLNESLFGMSITEIADKAGINRMTAAKYLDVMHAKNLIDFKKVGTSKLWITRERSYNLNLQLALIIEYFQLYNSAINKVLGEKRGEINREIGNKIGESIFEKYFPKAMKAQNFAELVEFCAMAMERVYPIPAKIEARIIDKNIAHVDISPCLCQGIPENISICDMQIGIIRGISKKIFADKITVEEEDCMCNGKKSCGYLIQYGS